MPIPTYVRRLDDLDGEDLALAKIEQLEWLMRVLPPSKITKDQVTELDIEKFNAILKKMEERLEYFQEHTEALLKKIEEQRRMHAFEKEKLMRENEEFRKSMEAKKCIIL